MGIFCPGKPSFNLLETIASGIEQIFCQSIQRRCHEHIGVFEHDVWSELQDQIFFHPLSYWFEIHFREMLEGHCDEVRIIIAKVVEENRQLVLLPQLEVTFRVSRTSILPSEMIVVSNLFLPRIVVAEISVANETLTLCRE